MMHRCKVSTWVVAAAMVSLVVGCASTPGADEEALDEPRVVQMETEPVLIRGGEDGAEQLSAEELFERAYYGFQARRYDEAAEYYGLIIEHFPDSRFHRASLYNGGLSYEEINHWEEAARAYERLVEEYPDSSEAGNAVFRLAGVLIELGEYEEVDEMLQALLLSDDLEHFDRVEAHVRRGQALFSMEAWDEAEESFNNALRRNQRADATDQLEDDNQWIVLAHFGIGEINHERMNAIPLVLPTERMREDLETKAEYHQAAQAAYIRAVRPHHPHWSVAAGYQIGQLYQDFYVDIFSAEIPDGLSEEELGYYFERLFDEIEVLMDRAISVYERNLAFSRRIARGQEVEDWVYATNLQMERMRIYLEDEEVQMRARELVLEHGELDLDKLWDPLYYAQRHVSDARDEADRAVAPEPESEEEPKKEADLEDDDGEEDEAVGAGQS